MRIHLLLIASLLASSVGCGPVHRAPRDPYASSGPAYATPSDGALAPGARVAAKWTDGKWYFGTITEVDDGRYAIDYADGDKGTVGPSEIHAIAPSGAVQPGAHVLAVWKGASMYPGRVDSVQNGQAFVRWDDGDTPLWVPLDRVALLDAQTAPAATSPPVANVGARLPVGTRVASKWKDGAYWFAAIGVVETDGYVIHYADGDVWKVGFGDVIPVAAPGTLQVGSHVLAVWKGAKMYPGVITAISGNAATVAWDDGDVPLNVPLDQIAPK